MIGCRMHKSARMPAANTCFISPSTFAIVLSLNRREPSGFFSLRSSLTSRSVSEGTTSSSGFSISHSRGSK